MDRMAARKYRENREAVDRLKERERAAALSPEKKLRRTAALFNLAVRLGWGRAESDPGVAAVRERWKTLRSRIHAR
jgi:hypothetical protein